MRHIYNFFLCLILPFLPLRFLWRSRKNSAYRKRILERFARFDLPTIRESIWIHAVSLGEATAAIPLIKIMLQRYSDLPIIVTTITPTGSEKIRKTFKDQVIQLYAPFDCSFLVRRFLNRINPKILIIMETELWPNILYYSAKRNIPILLSNARLSLKSFAGYKKIHVFMQKILACLTMVMAQTKEDATRFALLGLDPKKIEVAGNIKFDIEIPPTISSQAEKLRSTFGNERPIWIGASTHKMEEEKLLNAHQKVLQKIPDALLILVPRHPERFKLVFDLCCSQKFKTIKYSKLQNYTKATNIILGDVMGQLLLFYKVADIAFVGGSLIPWGGHNLLEPAALAKPILSGPHLHAFQEISNILNNAKGMIVVDNEKELAKQLIALFKDKSQQKKLGQNAWETTTKHQGATKKIAEKISKILQN